MSPGTGRRLGLPSLPVLLKDVEKHLERHGELGLLSVTLLEREAPAGEGGFKDYEAVLRRIATFLERFTRRRLRSSDLLLDPVVAGNTFVLLLGPPRDDRTLDAQDIAQVRHRLTLELNAHLRDALDAHTESRFGAHVGSALMVDEPGAERGGIIYRAFEEAVAEGLGHRRATSLREANVVREILDSGAVTPVYQPLVDTRAERVIGYEALTRVPSAHFRTPEALFRAASDHGALWALERLCRTVAIERLPALEPDQLVFLNIEPESFHDPQLRHETFRLLLGRHGLDPGRVVLELTEHAAVRDFDEMRRVLEEVREAGFRLAMDDVGSGYAGLQTIAEIRPDYLKVDMTLVRGVHLDPIKRELIATIRRFTDSTGIVLVAEGVETREELASLTNAGVRCAQGYLFARPAAAPDQPDWPTITLPPR